MSMPAEKRSAAARLFAALAAVSIALVAGCSVLDPLRARETPAEVNAGGAALAKGDRAAATRNYDAAIRANPTNFDVYDQIASATFDRRQFDLSARYATLGAERIPASQSLQKANLYGRAGNAYDRLGDVQKMISNYRHALEFAPNEPFILNGLGYAYAQAGVNLDEAISLTTRALKLAREKSMPREGQGAIVDSIGWAYYKQRRIPEAVSTLANAAEMSPMMAEIHYHLAMAYRAAGRDGDARVSLVRARALEPDNPLVQRELDSLNAPGPKQSGASHPAPGGPP